MTQEALKQRIKTTKDLHGIVHTMKMLSSVNVGQYEKALVSLNKYTETIKMAFNGLFLQDFFTFPIKTHKETEKHTLAILIGSDNGLVGRFNQELIHFVKEDFPELKNIKIISVGKRIAAMVPSLAVYSNSNSIKEISALADALLEKINSFLSKGDYEKVMIYYNEKNETSFKPKKFQLLPFSDDFFQKLKRTPWQGRMKPLIHKENINLFSELSKEYLIIFLIHFLTKSLACEHFIRMIHMQQAEQNIEKKLNELDLIYQQARQNQITNELIDIVSGAEAVKITP